MQSGKCCYRAGHFGIISAKCPGGYWNTWGRTPQSPSVGRKTVGQIVAGTAVEPNPIALLASDKPKTIVLDLVQPLLAARRSFRAAGKTWRDKAQVEDRNATACTLIESYVATIRNLMRRAVTPCRIYKGNEGGTHGLLLLGDYDMENTALCS